MFTESRPTAFSTMSLIFIVFAKGRTMALSTIIFTIIVLTNT